MNVYFDTNIFSYIRATNEFDAVSRLLANRGITLIGSSTNLFEILAIRDESIRQQDLHILTQLVSTYAPHPVSWLHAYELRMAIKQLHPEWLRNTRGKNDIPRLMTGHHKRWSEAKAGVMPPAEAFSAYRRDAESGAAAIGNNQKVLRQFALANKEVSVWVNKQGKPEQAGMLDPELAWRVDCMNCWFNAIVNKHAASRDYVDWLAPYLRPDSFRSNSYQDFWLKDISAAAAPLNRITGLTSFYQLKGKITHGNGQDQLHANHWWLSDLFVTADRQFHESLSYLAQNHFPEKRPPAFVIRGEDSFVMQLETILESFSLQSLLPLNV